MLLLCIFAFWYFSIGQRTKDGIVLVVLPPLHIHPLCIYHILPPHTHIHPHNTHTHTLKYIPTTHTHTHTRAVGTLASLLNKTSDAILFLNRSKSYKNVWSSENQLMCPRSSSGQFHCPLIPTFHEWMFKDSGYTEGLQEPNRHVY